MVHDGLQHGDDRDRRGRRCSGLPYVGGARADLGSLEVPSRSPSRSASPSSWPTSSAADQRRAPRGVIHFSKGVPFHGHGAPRPQRFGLGVRRLRHHRLPLRGAVVSLPTWCVQRRPRPRALPRRAGRSSSTATSCARTGARWTRSSPHSGRRSRPRWSAVAARPGWPSGSRGPRARTAPDRDGPVRGTLHEIGHLAVPARTLRRPVEDLAPQELRCSRRMVSSGPG